MTKIIKSVQCNFVIIQLLPFLNNPKDLDPSYKMDRLATVRENIWKMKFFPGQGKVREYCGWPGKFRKALESRGKVREFENKYLLQAVFRKLIYSVLEGKGCTFS